MSVRRKKEAIGHGVVALLSWVIPKKKGTHAFVSLQFEGRYGGNLKPVYEEVVAESESDRVWWVARYKSTVQELRGRGLPVKWSRIFWTVSAIRAEQLWVDGVRSPLGLGRFSFIQLWHGTGFKRIGIESLRRGGISRFLVRLFGRRTKFIIATSRDDAERKKNSLCVSNVVITGSPRNDKLLREAKAQSHANTIITYAPTFRDTGWRKQPISVEWWKRIDQAAIVNNWQFLVKRHPSDTSLVVPSGLNRVRDVTAQYEDVQDLLVRSSVLITDYSGIVNDWILLLRPTIWFMPDLEEYLLKDRGFYYDFPAILPGPIVDNESDLLDRVLNLGWADDFVYQAQFESYLSKFHERLDDGSTRRVIEYNKSVS